MIQNNVLKRICDRIDLLKEEMIDLQKQLTAIIALGRIMPGKVNIKRPSMLKIFSSNLMLKT